MAILCFLKDYNKYFNRIIKRPEIYTDVIDNEKVVFNNINFIPNDGVNTEQIINWNKDWKPDYMLELESVPPTPKTPIIEECEWFKLTTEDVLNMTSYTELVENNFYDSSTKILSLNKLAAWHNENYGNVTFAMEHNWTLDNFVMKMKVPNGVQLHIWSDQNDLTIEVYGDTVVDKEYLVSQGWDASDATGVWGFTVFGGSPDTFSGTIDFRDYTQNIKILDRWFVIEGDRTRKQQYNFKLRKDLVSDNYNGLRNCIANIDRCVVPDDNPLIFNKEPFEYNQIKTDEIPIYDRTLCPWIIGYMDNDGTVNYTDSSRIVLSEDYDIDMSNVAYEDWTYKSYIDENIKNNVRLVDTAVTISWNDVWGGGIIGGYAYQNSSRSWYNSISGQVGTNNEAIRYSESNFNQVKNSTQRHTWFSWTTANTRLLENITESNILTNSDISNLRSLNGMKVKFSNGIYKISFVANGSADVSKTKQNNTLATYVLDAFQSHVSGSVKHNYLDYTYRYDKYLLTVEEVTNTVSSGIDFVMTTSTNKLKDAPYRMFAIPLPNVNGAPGFCVKYVGTNKYYCDKDIILTLVQHMIRDLGTHLYDIQLLPYCPVAFDSYTYNTSNNICYAEMPLGNGGNARWTEGVDYGEIKLYQSDSSEWKGIVIYPKESSFKFTIDKTLHNGTYQNISGLFSIYNKKIQNETEFVRFCSPNYSSVFEFSPAKNDGIKSINIACTYKPFNPFVVVAPQFEGLYGKDYADNRGLILAGDYSLAQIGDAWINFQINNKAYAESFRREIQSMEKEYNIQKEEAGWQIFGGTVSGAASGALAGGMAGGGYGAAAGAVVGGVTSLIGGIIDYNNLDARQAEAMNYKKDMFRFQLQNIKAQPDTLEKTSAINANSKYVPFIEKYSATDQEKQLLSSYLTYNGYSAGFCGPIDMTGFVRANIIRFNDYIDEHELAELNVELKKGVYI